MGGRDSDLEEPFAAIQKTSHNDPEEDLGECKEMQSYVLLVIRQEVEAPEPVVEVVLRLLVEDEPENAVHEAVSHVHEDRVHAEGDQWEKQPVYVFVAPCVNDKVKDAQCQAHPPGSDQAVANRINLWEGREDQNQTNSRRLQNRAIMTFLLMGMPA